MYSQPKKKKVFKKGDLFKKGELFKNAVTHNILINIFSKLMYLIS